VECFAACGERQDPPEAPFLEQRQHSFAVLDQQTHQVGQHQRQRPGGRETAGRAWPDLDHHLVLPGESLVVVVA
jgi:hypothetical protein